MAVVSEEVCKGGLEPAPRPAPVAPREPYLVRATQNMVLQSREGCVIGPTLEVDPDNIHRSTTLVLDPDLPCNRIAFDGDRRCGFTQTKVQCSPTAMVTPRYIPEEDRVAVATTVINLGSEPLIIRQGDVVAKAYYPSVQDPEGEAQGVAALAAEFGKLAESPAAAFDHDGLPPDHPEFGVSGQATVGKVSSKCPRFIAWKKEFREQLRVGDAGTDIQLKEDVLKLLFAYNDVFAENPGAPNPISGVEHVINLVVVQTVVSAAEGASQKMLTQAAPGHV